MKLFVRLGALRTHESSCNIKLQQKQAKCAMAPLRPASHLAKDPVHSASGLQIGEGFQSKGEYDRELFFPETFRILEVAQAVTLPAGWARKGGFTKRVQFTSEQKDWLRKKFDHCSKLKEHDVMKMMQQDFKDKDPSSPYSYRYVLSASQIKSWFSSEASRRKSKHKKVQKDAAELVIEKAAAQVLAQVDLSQENLTLDEADRCVFVRDLECVNMH